MGGDKKGGGGQGKDEGGMMKDEGGNDPVRAGATIRDFARQLLIFPLVLMLGAFVGCAGSMSEPVQQPFSAAKHGMIRIQSCTDQSADRGNWDLAPEATRALTERVSATRHFKISAEPGLIFSCDVEGVVDRNAFQRGIAPVWGLSEVRVTVIVWEKPGDRIMAVFRGFAALPRGSMDTIDPTRRLVATAMDDVAIQLEGWVKAGGEMK
jgi:hypothetical protein